MKVPDLKNGAPELTKRTKKPFVFSVSFVYYDAPFLRSGTFVTSKRCSLSARTLSLSEQWR